MSDSTDLMLDSPVDGSIKAILEDAILPIGEFLILQWALTSPPKGYITPENYPCASGYLFFEICHFLYVDGKLSTS